jgi:vitamin K-dependent gamma-carboxylase
LATPVSGASLAAFRIAVGIIMMLEAYTLCRPSASTMGKSALETFYFGPDIKFWFPYQGFQWLPVLPGRWLYLVIGAQALAGLTLALGLFYRVSAVAVFLTWGYLYAVESTRTYWMSYYYLELLITFLLLWMPAAQRYSVDAWRAGQVRQPRPVPCWTVWLLRGQLVITYFYAGLAKLNADWLLDAQPVKYFLAKSRILDDYSAHLSPTSLASVKGVVLSPQFAYFISYAGVAFDLTVGFLLLIRRTRFLGLVLMALFHATNHFVLFSDLEWFPLLGLTTATIFLDPDWPERCWNWLRKPQLRKPNWPWLAVGGLAFPVVGLALGWKSKPYRPPAETKLRLARWTVPLAVGWLAWQSLLPLRQYLIPGDARFTWEGLCFSWRLKAEVYRSTPCKLLVEDRSILSRDAVGHARIDWTAWHGDKVIYRTVTPGHIDWANLPEIVVLLEPMIGERILYNPLAGSSTGQAQGGSFERVRHIWQEQYGRQPQALLPTAPLAQLLRPYAASLQSRGYQVKSLSDILQGYKELASSGGEAEVLQAMRQMHPFSLQGEASPATPFLVIEDAALILPPGDAGKMIDPQRWVGGHYTKSQTNLACINVGGDPVVVYMCDLGLAARELLPQVCLFDSGDHPEQPAYLVWNYLKELPNSKCMHMGAQPFLLRQYARHIATVWRRDYGRRPEVHAQTAVSLNGRPFQELVDPTADLASVSETWFGHNSWVRDLQTARIPREGPTLLRACPKTPFIP